MGEHAWEAPAAVDRPSSARVYDYLLGGRHHYAIDRVFAEQQLAKIPDIRDATRSNRAFVGRAVRFALDRGIRQFVDIGSGLPSQGQAHEVADRVAPEAGARVVYVDNEDIAVAHARILLLSGAESGATDPERHKAVYADFLEPHDLWRKVLDTGVIRPDEPTCLLVTAILHFVPPEREPEKALAYYRDQVRRGSVLVLTHGFDELDERSAREVAANYARTSTRVHLRSRAELTAFFGDWELVEPGVDWVVRWRPDGTEAEWWGDAPARSRYLAGVAVKP
ncbi:S-adenosyl methyltransferase [Amycolatopsis arida]|uniref:S-adenosyl methyltransferase n=1 Tax=Amycolatopsis arida TaxID=587909 RepID=A0A1I6AL03_9PSEU|nr:SAM-dependent methyltransferase [Amycolatopsis arida]TDX87363.1 S-adenosyl methyltransferase [Amycolatopsis arida]SFQ69365.1 S-adenosyl methyltransferase [Amycolatopsis arida]